ncbi:hypothetical protein CC1G_14247 [Coprinopsis cinerea okayama7|uniref:Uncharacterized protein n=1 Tax=Coprinopsis cinerea (strain Okayama-7 / 130 / ATCC MYA-4618 / FGSC 9003) TaxID=240176 RepID=D6RLQ4_COPC7|nr:hypothetical protein CC1G_14247 [Coprinopsis cinerea okayama7\|eukprot:XP_002911716.1 hypothetical protein CC1G_14247 [Coprinopsis cinerea okayama7\
MAGRNVKLNVLQLLDARSPSFVPPRFHHIRDGTIGENRNELIDSHPRIMNFEAGQLARGPLEEFFKTVLRPGVLFQRATHMDLEAFQRRERSEGWNKGMSSIGPNNESIFSVQSPRLHVEPPKRRCTQFFRCEAIRKTRSGEMKVDFAPSRDILHEESEHPSCDETIKV